LREVLAGYFPLFAGIGLDGQGIGRSVESHKGQLNLSLVLPKVREVTPSWTPCAHRNKRAYCFGRWSAVRRGDALPVRNRVGWLAAVLAVATAALVAPSSNATYRATNGLIAYQAWVGKHPHRQFQIFTVQPDGTHVHQLTHFGDSSAAWPDWSPDGRKIIFTRFWGEPGPPESFQLLTMNADGSAMRAVTSRGLDERASYLPDGRILYYRGSSHVWVVANPDGTHIRSTAIHQRFASLCVLSKGNRIALKRSLNLKVPDTLSALFVGRLFGGPDRLKRITRYQGMDVKIDCSPDGTRILFSTTPSFGVGSSNVFSVRTDGSGLVQLTRSQGGSVNNTAGSWSPDGTKIAFIRDWHQLYVMNADGTAVTQVTHGPEGAAWGSHR
jgi:dipeptidyl aminopeptidase/acylaminoacyl peptidase